MGRGRWTGLRVTLAGVILALLAGGVLVAARPPSAPSGAAPTSAEATAPEGSGRPPPVAGTVDPRDVERSKAVSDLLTRRADALLRRDEKAFLATVDPAADPAVRTAERKLFANLAEVPLSAWAYTVRPQDAVNLAELPVKAVGPAPQESWAPGVQLQYGLRGVDSQPTVRQLAYLFVKRDGNWYLRSDTALDAIGHKGWRGPWDYAPCKVLTTKRGLVLFHPGSEPTAERVAAELEPAVDAVSSVWGTDWAGKAAILVPDSAAEMRSLVGPTFPTDAVVAVAVADKVDPLTHRAEGQRVVLNPSGVRALSVAALRITLRHEITHVASRGYTTDGAPLWLLEGFADYVGYRDSGLSLAQGAPELAERVKRSGVPAALPGNGDFRTEGRDLDAAYQASWSVAKYLASRVGEAGLVTLYRKLASAGGVAAPEFDELLRIHAGFDSAALLAGWQQYLRTELK